MSVPEQEIGYDFHGYICIPNQHLAACDLAIVRGRLTTAMELTATHRPFIDVPLTPA